MSETETTTYKINQSDLPQSTEYECGHPLAAHGTRGIMCGACPMTKRCLQFTLKEREK